MRAYKFYLHSKYAFFFLVLCSTAAFSEECFDSAWFSLPLANQLGQLKSKITTLSEICLRNELSRIKTTPSENESNKLISLLQQWESRNEMENEILFAGYYNEAIHRNRGIWQAIIKLWDDSNGSPYATTISLLNSGEPLKADTLLKILDSEGKIGLPELLRWTKAKIIIKDYEAIPHLYCRILSKDPSSSDSNEVKRMFSIALNQFSSQMGELDKETADTILKEFCRCSLEKIDADTISIRSWLAQTYSRLEMYDKEIEILTTIQTATTSATLSTDLTDIARERFMYRNYIPALRAAKVAYVKAKNNDMRTDAASIIYQSFLAIGMQDSALIWLNKANITTESRMVEAIVLYQNSGQILQAELFLNKLRSSLSKDTLMIRQNLFTDNINAALVRLNESVFLKKNPQEQLLWKLRLFLFSKKLPEIETFFDSIPIPDDFDQANELLQYKYWLVRLQDCPEALASWAAIEYNIYRGAVEKCIPLVKDSGIDPTCQWRLALRIALKLHEGKKTPVAVSLLKSYDDQNVSAEFLFYKSQFLYETGDFDNAKALLQKLVLEFSSDIFSNKARLLLAKLDLK